MRSPTTTATRTRVATATRSGEPSIGYGFGHRFGSKSPCPEHTSTVAEGNHGDRCVEFGAAWRPASVAAREGHARGPAPHAAEVVRRAGGLRERAACAIGRDAQPPDRADPRGAASGRVLGPAGRGLRAEVPGDDLVADVPRPVRGERRRSEDPAVGRVRAVTLAGPQRRVRVLRPRRRQASDGLAGRPLPERQPPPGADRVRVVGRRARAGVDRLGDAGDHGRGVRRFLPLGDERAGLRLRDQRDPALRMGGRSKRCSASRGSRPDADRRASGVRSRWGPSSCCRGIPRWPIIRRTQP